MREDLNYLISEMDLNEMKDLAVVLERLTKSTNNDIKVKAEKSLLKLLEFIDKALDKNVVNAQGYWERMIVGTGDETEKRPE